MGDSQGDGRPPQAHGPGILTICLLTSPWIALGLALSTGRGIFWSRPDWTWSDLKLLVDHWAQSYRTPRFPVGRNTSPKSDLLETNLWILGLLHSATLLWWFLFTGCWPSPIRKQRHGCFFFESTPCFLEFMGRRRKAFCGAPKNTHVFFRQVHADICPNGDPGQTELLTVHF